MPLVKSRGNMYDWVTHMHTHLAGQCSHKCSYCYVQRGVAKISGRYSGSVRLIEKELAVNYGSSRVIFIEHMNDMFAEDVKGEWIEAILDHCHKFSTNRYVFQTKNPRRAIAHINSFPKNALIGTTIESNRHFEYISSAPHPFERMACLRVLRDAGFPVFVTIEPILQFDPEDLAYDIKKIAPDFVNIGADSKGAGLPEPDAAKIRELIARLNSFGIEIKKKVNLSRILEQK